MSRIAPLLAFAVALMLAPMSADAASSCHRFAMIKAFDADAKTVEIADARGSESRFFPRPEGGGVSVSKLPTKCRKQAAKDTVFPVKLTGGRMTVTQVRANFSGGMRNDTEDPAWLPAKLKQLIDEKSMVVVVIRPGMKKGDPLGLTTIYLPITDEELDEIERIESQIVDD